MSIQEVKELVMTGKAKKVAAAVQEAMDEGIQAQDLLNAMIEAMGEVGDKFSRNEIFVPEMLVAAKAMKKGVEVLKPNLGSGEIGAMGKMIMGTVKDDLHDIGKNLVIMMIESAGFEVIDLGVDVPAQTFIDTYNANPDTKIIGLSALLTTTMPQLEEAVSLINEQPWRGNVKVMVGGAPITEEFANKIGADAYTSDAASAAQKAKELVSA